MTETPVERVYDQLPSGESGVHPDPVRRAWVYMSLFRNDIHRPTTARPTDDDCSAKWRRYGATPARRSGIAAGALVRDRRTSSVDCEPVSSLPRCQSHSSQTNAIAGGHDRRTTLR